MLNYFYNYWYIFVILYFLLGIIFIKLIYNNELEKIKNNNPANYILFFERLKNDILFKFKVYLILFIIICFWIIVFVFILFKYLFDYIFLVDIKKEK